ncbi:uncharacterized protein LOC113286879 isoform X3 [Papaver somniferum]|uniref:uncharacterized protein LOC113286879 isoform X3 n=1 Tax=Papaver somniferum TaxID=3469 RepID=UPI000E6F9D3D|nr:uncharacterized protein LOC113286879 isoform X3 [Papaver somniferum]
MRISLTIANRHRKGVISFFTLNLFLGFVFCIFLIVVQLLIWMVLKNHQEPATFWSNRCNLKLMCSQYVITSTIRHQNHQAIQVLHPSNLVVIVFGFTEIGSVPA